MKKRELIQSIVQQLEMELAVLENAARAAHEAATHAESRAEDSHDTRGLEASYLAGAQAKRAAEIKRQIQLIQQLPVREFSATDAIGLGACVELQSKGKRSLFFLVPQGGGMQLPLGEQKVNLISSISPMGEELLGRKEGERIEVENPGGIREYIITAIG